MLRGFRWQLVALVMACLLFAVSFMTTRQETPPATPEPPPPTETPIPATETPIPPTPNVVIEPVNPEGGVTQFREGLIGRVQRINPILADMNPVDRDISALIFEGLTRINPYGEPEAALAREWVISSNGLEYTVTLRDDVLWQDGVPFSGADVAYTMGLLRSPDFPGDPQVGAFWRTVETEQLSDHIIRFRLTQPIGSFLDKLAIGILPVHALLGTEAKDLIQHPFNLSPIGTGPYQLEALRSSDNTHIDIVDLRVAPVYRQRAEGQSGYAIDRFSFHLFDDYAAVREALANGAIDGFAEANRQNRADLLNLATMNQLQAHTTLSPTLGILIFNWQSEDTRYFREQRVRLALETGLDRGSAIERWLFNTAVKTDSPLLPGSWAYDSTLEMPNFDPVQARSLIETANLRRGQEDDMDETTSEEGEVIPESSHLLRFEILTPNDSALVNVAGEIAAQWSQLNLDVSVQSADAENYQARLESGDFDVALVELSMNTSADPDVYAFWHEGQYPDGANYGGVDDRRISEVLERARRDPSGLNRKIHYAEFQDLFIDRAIALPLYVPLFTYITAAPVEGVQIGFIGAPQHRFQTLHDWTIRD